MCQHRLPFTLAETVATPEHEAALENWGAIEEALLAMQGAHPKHPPAADFGAFLEELQVRTRVSQTCTCIRTRLCFW